MIRYAEGDLLTQATQTFGGNPFGVRALAGVLAYGTAQPFTGAWVQSEQSLLIGRTESAVTVCGTAESAEFQVFLNLVGGSSLLLPADFLHGAELPGWTLRRSGAVLRAETVSAADLQCEWGTAREVAALMVQNPSPWIEIGDADAFYTDVSHRLRHGCMRAKIIHMDEKPIACALTVAETAQAAVIGGVVCQAEYRGRGYAGAVLRALCASLQHEDKCAFLFTGNEMVPFYRKQGFVQTEAWHEYRCKE